ncbi:hypothetical protein LCGC14_1061860 [marine sediment metagenome]|uniref:Uncharacterized protein n=1 Tax=marine sediment metagenome TaxID=412755 RepID=A0A0F9N7V5_9ZZZZ
MGVTTLQEALDFMGVDSKGVFIITAANDKLVLTSDQGGPSTIDIPDTTYEGTGLASAVQTAMNADNTLTGTGTITFAVSYSSSTSKFTIDATVGFTIDLTFVGSDAALTLGFSADTTAAQTIVSDTAVPADPSDIVTTIHAGVEAAVLTYCDRDAFDSNSYTHEKYRGNDGNLYLRNWPVTDLIQISTSVTAGLQIKNTATDVTRATAKVDVSAQTLTLTVTGGTSASSESIDLSSASYDTLTELVARVNALGNGWSAQIATTDLNSILSTELLEQTLRVGSRGNRAAGWHDLDIPDPLDGVEFDEDFGAVYGRFSGRVYVSYTGGFATIPNDLKMAVLRWIKLIDGRVEENADGLDTADDGDLSVKYTMEIPEVVKLTLDDYRNKAIV